MSSVSFPLNPAHRIRTYASFVRFEHTLFSLPLILAGVFSAPGPAMSWRRWALVVVAAVGARTAAMALNRLIDRGIDAINPRTRGRELPSGAMRPVEAWALLIGSVIAYLAACAALGPFYLKVAAVPLAVFLAYPYLKRWTPLCHFGVGLALALAPLAGYAAAHPDLSDPKPALWLAAFALAWVSGFDIIYATLDEDFDRGHGVHSMVAWLGRGRALVLSAFLHALAFACIIVALFHMGAWRGAMNGLEIYFHSPWPRWVAHTFALALAALAALLFLEVKWAADVDLAFFKVNVVVGAVVFLLVLLVRIGMANLTGFPGAAR